MRIISRKRKKREKGERDMMMRGIRRRKKK